MHRTAPQSPSESANSITYPLSTDENLADTYRNPWGQVRAGRLLEDLDALAGTVAFDHCQTPGEPDLHIVTASVDRIVYRHRPNLQECADAPSLERVEGAWWRMGRRWRLYVDGVRGVGDARRLDDEQLGAEAVHMHMCMCMCMNMSMHMHMYMSMSMSMSMSMCMYM